MTKTINVSALARVEGEGGLYIGVKDGKAHEIKVNIYEPPRFFEGFLQGRYLQDVPDITARICGICPVAYQMSSVRALEKALKIETSAQTRDLRSLLYCGEWIESHVLHIYMLQGPDLTGHESAISLAEVAPETVAIALRLKKIGNSILKAIGGRSVHPVNACVGGFYKWPEIEKLQKLLPDLEWGLEQALETVRWSMTLPYPDFDVDYEYVALTHPDEYAILEGDILSSKIGKISEDDFEKYYLEKHVEHSNAIHSHGTDGQPYFVGPLARFNLNYEQLGDTAKQIAAEVGVEHPINNPYKGLIARAVETVEAFDRAIRLIKEYNPNQPSAIELKLTSGEGAAGTEAPRGMLYHRYKIDDYGMIQEAKIMPPTAQNLARMEADLWQLAPTVLALEHDEATLTCEHLLRSYDPCISCATHFLKLEIKDI
ncbi:MAG: Ni/Fe hydrogenase subunit alpha [Chloroflexota bacterium]